MKYTYFTLPKLDISFCFLNISQSAAPENFLSPSELSFYHTNCNTTKRKKEFLFGRIASKIAITSYLNYEIFKNINIERGIFQQPIITSNTNNMSLSISHCDNLGVAIRYHDKYLAGVDIEKVRMNNISVVTSMFIDKVSLYNLAMENEMCEALLATLFWASSESLSKALKTGFSANPVIFTFEEIKKEKNVFIIKFRNFKGFRSYAYILGDYVFSLTIPDSLCVDIQKIRSHLVDWWNNNV